jgi:hypothetical protein
MILFAFIFTGDHFQYIKGVLWRIVNNDIEWRFLDKEQYAKESNQQRQYEIEDKH